MTPRNQPDGSSLYPSTASAFRSFLSLLLGLVVLFGCQTVWAAQPTTSTLFLPFKINAPENQEKLIAASDAALKTVLKKQGVGFIPRDTVKTKIGYDTAWPPTVDAVMPLIGTSATNYVAAGSITRLGGSISIDLTVLDTLGQAPPKYFYQEAESGEGIPAVTEKIVKKVLSYTEKEFLVSTILIKGNQKTDSGAILHHIKTQSGDRYAPGQLREDLKNIFKMGYFDDVQIDVADTENGKEITFIVTEKSVIGQVTLTGNKKIKEDEVRDVITVSPNTIINTKEVQTSVENIRKLYKEKGFYTTKVTANLEKTKAGRINVRFDIKEGFKVYIKEIRLVGNKAFKDKELKKVMATSEKGWFSWITESGRLKRDILEQDRARIGAFYHNNGYIEAKVSAAKITRKGEWLYITFDISEGNRYRVGTIDLDGELIEDKNDLLALVKLGEQKYFSRKVLREDVLRLTDRYAEKGYAFAEAVPSLEKNAEYKRMDVIIHLQKGQLVHVNRIVIRGNTRTRDKVIRRQMKLKEGGIFDASALQKSTKRLQRLDYFEEVNITPEPTAREDLMDILVDLKEKPTGTFSIGAGYSSVDNLMFMGEISQNNFMGKGQRLAFQSSLSSSQTRFNLSFTEPHLNDSKLLFGIDLYNWQREYDDYTKDSKGGALRFAYPLWNRWNAFWSYGYDYTELTDVRSTAAQSIKDSLDLNVTSFVRLGVVRDTRDKSQDATTGSRHSIGLKHAGGILGGDSYFTRLEASTSWYFPWGTVPVFKNVTQEWFNDTTFHLKGEAGYAVEHEEGKLPVYEKFYLGGLNTVRGFDNGKISPRDPVTGERIGGEKMWFMNAEWLFPLSKELGLKGLVFFDAGNVYADSENWDLGDLKKSVGLGFRWLSPMGPLRLEWGYNLDPEPDEDRGVWDFSMGGSF